MKIIKIRSPFVVSVDEFGQDGSKIELFIWNKGTTEPTLPTYSLSKSIVSGTQTENIYNISNYIKEYITHPVDILPISPEQENNNNWAVCKVKRYKVVADISTLLNTETYFCVDGFTLYEDGLQVPYDTNIDAPALVLNNENDVFINTLGGSYDGYSGYVNLVFEKTAGITYTVTYLNANNTVIDSLLINTGSATNGTYFNFKIPFRSELFEDNQLIQKLQISYNTNILFQKRTITTLECKFTPVLCSFINRSGGWEFLTFFKQQTNSIAVKGSEYKLAELNRPSLTKKMNTNGKQNIKLNTGWVNENYSELITDLLLSEDDIYLDNKPVTIKTQSSDLKSYLKERNINYEIDFEYSYNLINDAI